MRQQSLIIMTVVLTIFLSCQNNRKFPEVTDLSQYEKTEFLPTLENKINEGKNSVYCVSLLYAWDEIRKVIKAPLQIDSNFYDLTLLNNSKSYIDVLKSDEYSASGEVDGDLIKVRAEFKKSLPFEIKLTSFNNELTFDNVKVASFGTFGYDYEISKIIRIVYYKNDNNFIIKLIPKDNEHEIILFMSEKKFTTMIEMISEIESKIEIGNTEKQNDKLSWKYYLAEEDEVVIPKFKFNIATNYSAIEGNGFKTKEREFLIETAWQRTAFILDESGAELESETEVYALEEMEEDINKPKPKKMRFDKPFFLILKRIDNKYPYFGMWTLNTELMIRE